MKTALEKAIEIMGGQTGLAEAIGVQQPHVWNWLNRAGSTVPAEYCPSIERVTKGEVSCEELRPDVDWAVLRRKKRKAA